WYPRRRGCSRRRAGQPLPPSALGWILRRRPPVFDRLRAVRTAYLSDRVAFAAPPIPLGDSHHLHPLHQYRSTAAVAVRLVAAGGDTPLATHDNTQDSTQDSTQV